MKQKIAKGEKQIQKLRMTLVITFNNAFKLMSDAVCSSDIMDLNLNCQFSLAEAFSHFRLQF